MVRLGGQLATPARQVDGARLEQPQRRHAARPVALCDVEQRAEQRRAEPRLLARHRILELDRRLIGQPQPLGKLRRDEAPADDLVQPLRRRRIGMPAVEAAGVRVSRPEAPWRLGSVAGSLSSPSIRATSSITSASRVTSARRKGGGLTSRPSLGIGRPELQRLEDLPAALARRRAHRAGGDAGITQPNRGRRRARAADVDRARQPARAAKLHHQLRRDGLRLDRLLGLKLLLEPGRGLAAQPELQRGSVDVGAIPGRDLHQHAGRVVRDLRPRAAHHARDRCRPVGVLDHHHLGVERAASVRRASRSARPRPRV